METKWKLLFRDQRLRLLCKAAVFALLFIWFGGRITLLSAVFLAAATVIMYVVPFSNPLAIPKTFFIFVVLAFFIVMNPPITFSVFFWAVILAVVFYLMLGIKNLFFVHRERAYAILAAILLYLALLLFFSGVSDEGWWWRLFALFLVVYIFMRDLFSLSREKGEYPASRTAVFGVTIALIAVETVWALSLLPLPFIYAVHIAFAGTFIAAQLVRRYFLGTFSRDEAILSVSVILLIFLFTFGVTQWSW